MRLDPRRWLATALARGRRLERREVASFRRWIENTSNLVHLSVLLLVPLLMALVTVLSNALAQLSFLLFPPLASGTYTLFADPEGKYADPVRFVAGLTVGGICGWTALELSVWAYGVPAGALGVHPESAALAVLLTGGATWALDVEIPSAFSTALLILLVNEASASPLEYVLAVLLSASVVAVTFALWRSRFYERRARYLYESTRGDDHVLVPVRGETGSLTAVFGARLAAAHDAGKVVLLDVVDDERRAAVQRRLIGADDAVRTRDVGETTADADGDEAGTDAATAASEDATTTEAGDDATTAEAGDDATTAEAGHVVMRDESDDPSPFDTGVAADADDVSRRAAAEAAETLEGVASRIRTRIGVPCEVVVAAGSPIDATLRTARETNCDLIVAPYETEQGFLSGYVRALFRGRIDTVAVRSRRGQERWKRVLVAVSRPGDSAHAMIDFAERLAGRTGSVSLCTCIDSEVQRRPAEDRLANLAETATGSVETRVARADIEAFLDANADAYDLVIIGSSRDRSAASRFVSPPTFERIQEIDTDVAVVDRGDVPGFGE